MPPVRPKPTPSSPPQARRPLPQRPDIHWQTPWEAHHVRWKGGCGQQACRVSKVALARGTLPCDVLFIGQAPGATESRFGEPFVGPAGIEEDAVIAEAERQAAQHEEDFRPLRKAFCNLVGCMPLDEEGRKADVPPPDEQVKACSLRLVEMVEVAAPKLVFALGKVAWEWLEPGYKHGIKLLRPVDFATTIHPAAILKAPIANKEMLRRRSIIAHRDAFVNLFRLLREGED